MTQYVACAVQGAYTVHLAGATWKMFLQVWCWISVGVTEHLYPQEQQVLPSLQQDSVVGPSGCQLPLWQCNLTKLAWTLWVRIGSWVTLLAACTSSALYPHGSAERCLLASMPQMLVFGRNSCIQTWSARHAVKLS